MADTDSFLYKYLCVYYNPGAGSAEGGPERGYPEGGQEDATRLPGSVQQFQRG